MDTKLLSSIYIGRNVVRQHLDELFQMIDARSLRLDQEEIVAVFDCIIMEAGGTRVGGLTLHDYAILTNQNLITWGRGRSKNTIDKFAWPYLTINSFGRRNAIEGAIKFTYRPQAATGKRKISLRTKDANPPIKEADQQNGESEKGIILYLDLMPLEEVPVCHRMMKFFITNYFKELDVAEFQQNFQKEIEASVTRIASLPAVTRPQSPDNGYSEETDEEEKFLRLLEVRQRHPNPPINPYRGFSSPYQLQNSGPAKPSEANPAKPSNPRSYDASPASGMSSPALSGKPSKLDAFESGDSGFWQAQPVPAQKPLVDKPRLIEKEKAPVEISVEKPAPRPLLRDARTPGDVLTESVGNARSERTYTATNPTTIADAPNIYTISRIAHGLLEGPQNLGRNLSDVSETAAVLASLPGLLSNNTTARQASLNKLRGIFEGGYLENNSLLSFAITPLLKPLIGGFAPSELRTAPKRERLNIQVAGKKKDAASRESMPSYENQTERTSFKQSSSSIGIDENFELPMLSEEIATDNLADNEIATPDLNSIPVPALDDQATNLDNIGPEPRRIKFGKS